MRAFWRGFGSVLEICPTSRKQSGRLLQPKSVEEALRADAQKLAGDWQKVGLDVDNTIQKGLKLNKKA